MKGDELLLLEQSPWGKKLMQSVNMTVIEGRSRVDDVRGRGE